MRNIAKDSLTPSSIFVKGQLWQIEGRFTKIGHVGRLLVHHRTVDPVLNRTSRESVTAIKALQQFLTANHAVLVENA
ncbi:MAG TPA: hypothetical protein VK530_06920 [Candidatus Acidoferrum sp.]|nr:hypothetical protein [Candidatus Acidoferrum sp.]